MLHIKDKKKLGKWLVGDEIAYNRWVFTCWKKPQLKEELVHYMVWQKELCPDTLKYHYQGFVIFKKDYKLFQVKSLFKDKRMYCDKAKMSNLANVKYCTKSETFADERYECGFVDTGVYDEIEWSDLLDGN